MTRVSFHFNVADRRDYACRLLRKATRAGSRLVVTGPAALLSDLDKALWTFDPLEFLPHWRGDSLQRLPAVLRSTPVLLLERPEPAEGYDVLLNLGPTVPPACEAFDRLIEVVSRQESDRLQARERWRHYAQAGLPIERHEVNA